VRFAALVVGLVGCGRVGFDAVADGHDAVADGRAPGDGAITAGLVAWWKLDDGSGTIAADSSGNDNPLTLVGSPVWGTGRSGGDLTFDGVDQEADATNDVAVAAALTYSFWVATSTSSAGNALTLGLYAGCELVFSPDVVACTPDGILHLTAPLASDGQWHQLVYVSAGTNAAQSLYLDGALQMSVVGTMDLTRGTAVCLGSGCGNYYVSASLQDVRFYDRALAAGEVAALFQ
jgi:hypothetical protein